MSFIGQIQKMASRIGPWFIHQKNIGSFIEAYASILDSAILSLEQGLRLSQPLRCDESALPVLSKDRTIRLYPTESIASKRLRLSRWLQLHRARGTALGEMQHSQPYFLPETPIMRIVHQDGAGASATWWTLGADGVGSVYVQSPSNWNYDGQTAKWSRFWVILYAPAALVSLAEWDDGSLWDDTGLWWDGFPVAQVARDLVDMIKEWKAPHSRLAGYIVATDPMSFDPTAPAVVDAFGRTTLPVGNWGSSVSPPPDSHPTRLPTAIWIYEDKA